MAYEASGNLYVLGKLVLPSWMETQPNIQVINFSSGPILLTHLG